jgi:hypothetical protein|tara:strand:+ start:4037 stop:4549 length:513 start_codon:yes stop_codon:yes gene_type:complete
LLCHEKLSHEPATETAMTSNGTDSELKLRIQAEMKDALRAKNKQRLGALRLAFSEIRKVEIDERTDLDDARVIQILDKMTKQRRDAQSQYEKAERQELADQEKFEIEVLAEFLPQQLDDGEIDDLIIAAISETGADSMREMGKIMAIIKPKVQGKADMGEISQKVKARLS